MLALGAHGHCDTDRRPVSAVNPRVIQYRKEAAITSKALHSVFSGDVCENQGFCD